MKLAKPPESEDRIDMTPMIDMVFELIIFFMVVTNEIKVEMQPINLPFAERSVVPSNTKNRCVITVKEDGTLYLGTRITDSLEAITARIVKGKEDFPEATYGAYKVVLRGDARAEHKKIREVMKAVADAECGNIIFSAMAPKKN